MDTVQRITILPKEPIGIISPHLHGQFAEHLGTLVYPGLFVDPASPIPNSNGLRQDVIAALRQLAIPVLRWPGGCFADNYHWRDGIGPREQRPQRMNVHWGMVPESNAFGTHEFLEVCRQIGAEPYLAANIGSGTPAEMRDWIEYCNADGDSTLARERQANGAEEPFGVRLWGVGNESWACGGNLSPGAYAERYAQFRTFAFDYPGTPLEAIACGPSGNDWDWTRQFFETLQQRVQKRSRLRLVQGFAAHYYCFNNEDSATNFTESEWLALLTQALSISGIITGHRQIMDEYDPERHVKLIIDEWGAWHRPEPGTPSSGLYQQNTLRDACVAAITLDCFNNYADMIHMANLAQVVNVLQALLLVEGDHCVKTPTYHVFDLYRPHRGAIAIPLINGTEIISHGESRESECRNQYFYRQALPLRVVQGSASLRDNQLCVTLVNAHPSQSVEVELELHQGLLQEIESVTLLADDIHAHNTFDEPDQVRLSVPVSLHALQGRVRTTLAPGSVTRLRGGIHL